MKDEPITPETSIGDILKQNPEILDFLVGFSTRFAALRNPVMRRTVGRMASVAQAAAIAGVPVPELVMALRREMGQDGVVGSAEAAETPPVARPEWVRQARPAAELDGDELIGQGRAPVTVLRQRLSELAPGELLLFRVSFKPEPLIRTLEHQGYGLYLEPASGGGWQVWVREAGGRS